MKGDFVNNVTAGNIFTSGDGYVIFNGDEAQHINGTASKSLNYANFTNIRVNNPNGVEINPLSGVETKILDLPRGRIVLKSAVNASQTAFVDVAHLLVSGSVNYNRSAVNAEDKGVVQVELALGDNYLSKRLVGFSPPFKNIYGDYFLYNFLSKPSPAGLFGDTGNLLTDINVQLKAGEGFILGQGIIDDENYYNDQVDPQWQGALFSERATTKFSFARNFMQPSLGQFLTADSYFVGEELNISDVPVSLTRQGFNYVGNPFTTPLDLSDYVNDATVADRWGVTRSADGAAELRSSFYVMSGGTGAFHPEFTYSRFTFSVSYLLGQAVGGTISYPGGQASDLEIAPMQMFIVGKNANTPSTLTIPASARIHGISQFMRRSSPQNNVIDEILIEVTDEDTQAFDRLCVVFRSNASLSATDRYDATKLFNTSRGVSQIYTKSSEGKSMTTNVFSAQTTSLPMYLDPSLVEKAVTISAHRLQSLQSIDELFLEDKKTNQIVDLMQNPSYTCTTSPADASERFVLHFTRISTSIEGETLEKLNAYYTDGNLYIKGLSAEDEGSTLLISNMQGLGMYKNKIEQSPDMNISLNLPTGVYIVKVLGNNNRTAKIITK